MLRILGLTALLLVGAGDALAQPAASAPAAQQDPNRLICRTTQETGSFARRRRQCFTRAQWEQIAAAARDNAQDMQDRYNPPTPPCRDPTSC